MSTQEQQPKMPPHTHIYTCAVCNGEIDPIVDAYVRGYPRDLGSRTNGIMIYMRLALGIDVPQELRGMAEALSNEDREVGNALLGWPGPMISHDTAAVRIAPERIRREHIGCHDFSPRSGNYGPTGTHAWMLFKADDPRPSYNEAAGM